MNKLMKKSIGKKAIRAESGKLVEDLVHAACANIYLWKSNIGTITIRNRGDLINIPHLNNVQSSRIGLAVIETAEMMGYMKSRMGSQRAWSLTQKGIDHAHTHPTVIAFTMGLTE